MWPSSVTIVLLAEWGRAVRMMSSIPEAVSSRARGYGGAGQLLSPLGSGHVRVYPLCMRGSSTADSLTTDHNKTCFKMAFRKLEQRDLWGRIR